MSRASAAARRLKGPFKALMANVDTVLKKPAKVGKVKPLEVGHYSKMKPRPGRTGMHMDHIPSKAALLEHARTVKGRRLTPAERRKIANSGVVVAVPKDLHQKFSRTFGGRNAKHMYKDAADLKAAIRRDLETYRPELVRRGLSPDKIEKVFSEIIKLNKGLRP